MMMAFFKAHDGMERTYTVADPLPDDAEFVCVLFKHDGFPLALILKSETWPGQSEVPLKPPLVTVHYGCRPEKEGE